MVAWKALRLSIGALGLVSAVVNQAAVAQPEIRTLAPDLEGPSFLTVDEFDVYWGETSGSVPNRKYRIKKVRRDGGGVSTLRQRGLGPGRGAGKIAVQNGSIFLAYTHSGGYGEIVRQDQFPSSFTQMTSTNQSFHMDVDETHVYWADNNGGTESFNGIRRIPLEGGAVETLTTQGTANGALALDDDSVYFSHSVRLSPLSRTQRITRVGKDGSGKTALVDRPGGASAMLVHEGFVYWTESTLLNRIRTDGTDFETLASDLENPKDLLVYDEVLYFTEEADGGPASGSIGTYSLRTQARDHLLLGLGSPYGLTIAEGTLYWTERNPGRLRAVEVSAVELTFDEIPSPQQVGMPFPVTVTARDALGNVVDLDADIGLVAGLGLVPTPDSVRLVNGIGSLDLELEACATEIALGAFGQGFSGTSNEFTLESSPFPVPSTGVLHGRVLREGVPLTGATVHTRIVPGGVVENHSTLGAYFTTPPLATWEYEIWASHSGVEGPRQRITVDCSRDLTVDLTVPLCQAGDVPPVLLVPGFAGSSTAADGCSPALELPPLAFDDSRWGDWGLTRQGGLFQVGGYPGWTDLQEALFVKHVNYQPNSPRDTASECAVYPVPWDWRLSVSSAARTYLGRWVDRALAEHPGQSHVNIVTHSTGALLARDYINSFDEVGPNSRKVGRLAMLAPPNQGATYAYYPLQGGDTHTADNEAGIGWDRLACWTGGFYTRTARRAYRDWTGEDPPVDRDAYQPKMRQFVRRHVRSLGDLMPTLPFLDRLGSLTAPTCEPNEYLLGLNLRDRDPLSSNLADPAYEGTEHKVRTLIFAGTGVSTLATINVGKPASACSEEAFWADGNPLGETIKTDEGDGTVLRVATRIPGRPELGPTDSSTFDDTNHVDIVREAKDGVAEFLCPLGDCQFTGGADALVAQIAHGAEPPPPSNLLVALDGRIDPFLEDPSGNGTGLDPVDGQFKEQIPGSSVDIRGSSSSIEVESPAVGSYELTLGSSFDETVAITIAYVSGDTSAISSEHALLGGGDLELGFALSATPGASISLAYAPEPPSALSAELGSGSLTSLSWTASPSADVAEYRVYERALDRTTFSLLGTTTDLVLATGIPWAGDAATPVTLFAVTAVDSLGNQSFLSNQVTNDDRDSDGVTDTEEAALGTNPDIADSDGDGLSDGEERNLGTDPTLADSDGDGYSDGEEVAGGFDPLDPNWSPADIYLYSRTVDTPEQHHACNSITIGPNLIVSASGDLELTTGNIAIIRNGFTAEVAGTVSIAVDSGVICD